MYLSYMKLFKDSNDISEQNVAGYVFLVVYVVIACFIPDSPEYAYSITALGAVGCLATGALRVIVRAWKNQPSEGSPNQSE